MIRGRWRYLVAAAGLTTVCLLGQAQERQQQPELTPNEQEASSDQFPVPLPVVVIESEEITEANKRKEEESREREESDLDAQEGMHTHTKRMANYAYAQTILIFIGTFALIWTLWETRKVSKIANDTVIATKQMGLLQTRAWLKVLMVSYVITTEEDIPEKLSVTIGLRNHGMSPARDVKCDIKIIFTEKGNADIGDVQNKWGEELSRNSSHGFTVFPSDPDPKEIVCVKKFDEHVVMDLEKFDIHVIIGAIYTHSQKIKGLKFKTRGKSTAIYKFVSNGNIKLDALNQHYKAS
jgi:hypothetical protein